MFDQLSVTPYFFELIFLNTNSYFSKRRPLWAQMEQLVLGIDWNCLNSFWRLSNATISHALFVLRLIRASVTWWRLNPVEILGSAWVSRSFYCVSTANFSQLSDFSPFDLKGELQIELETSCTIVWVQLQYVTPGRGTVERKTCSGVENFLSCLCGQRIFISSLINTSFFSVFAYLTIRFSFPIFSTVFSKTLNRFRTTAYVSSVFPCVRQYNHVKSYLILL